MIKPSNIKFVNKKIKENFNELKKTDKKLYEFIKRALKDIQENAFCGEQIRKRLIPMYYIKKYEIKNLWKYNLPRAWRLLYSIEADNLLIMSIVLEWLDHKSYERRFKY